MNVRASVAIVITVVFCLVAGGCATIFSGTKQKISVNSNVDGAEIFINGILIGKTPFMGEVTREKEATLTVKREGYKTQEMVLSTSVEGIFWGNILCGGTIGSSTDYSTGAMWSYSPSSLMANLQKEGQSNGERDRFERESMVRYFVLFNYDRLSQDIAKGDGEYFSALAELVGAPSDASRERLLSLLRCAVQDGLDAPGLAEVAVSSFGCEMALL